MKKMIKTKAVKTYCKVQTSRDLKQVCWMTSLNWNCWKVVKGAREGNSKVQKGMNDEICWYCPRAVQTKDIRGET